MGVLCPGLGTGREVWMSQVSLEVLDSPPWASWDIQASVHPGLAEKRTTPSVHNFVSSESLVKAQDPSTRDAFLGRIVCKTYPAHCCLCEGIVPSRSSRWQAALTIERL